MHYVNAIWLVPTYIPTFRREVFDVGVMTFSESNTYPTIFICPFLCSIVALAIPRYTTIPHSIVCFTTKCFGRGFAYFLEGY